VGENLLVLIIRVKIRTISLLLNSPVYWGAKLLNEEVIAKCKADRNYGPASVLLKRIKAEKKKK